MSVDPASYLKSGTGSGSKRAKITHKKCKGCFGVLDVLFRELVNTRYGSI
jgi:hypothetical protein